MAMFAERIDRETPELDEEGVRMRFIGRREGLDPELVRRMDWAEEKTAGNERITLFVAFNYGGRAEIVDAARTFTGGTEEEFSATSTRPTCTIPTSSSGPAASSASRTTCSGSSPTPSSCSATSCGRTSRVRRSRSRSRSSPRASAGSGALMDARRASGGGSDLAPRIVFAIPAIVFAIFIVWQGGWSSRSAWRSSA